MSTSEHDLMMWGWGMHGPQADVSGMTYPARCVHCQRVYDLAKVEVTARYADCSVWRTPCCRILADDRTPPWGVRHYWELDEYGQEKRQR